MSAPMPWWRVMTGASQHQKVLGLCAVLENDLADAYWWRLLDHCAQHRPDGLFTGPAAAGVVEQAARFGGPRGALTEAMLQVGLLERTADGLLVHDWQDIQSALVAKFERDRGRGGSGSRPNSSRPPRGVRADSVRETSGVSADSAEGPPGVSPLSTLASRSEGVLGEAPAPDLRERLCAAFLEAKGYAYDWDEVRDMQALQRLRLEGKSDPDELVRRARNAFARTRYPTAFTVADLLTKRVWSAAGAPEAPPLGTSPPRRSADATRGVVRVDDNDWGTPGVSHGG